MLVPFFTGYLQKSSPIIRKIKSLQSKTSKLAYIIRCIGISANRKGNFLFILFVYVKNQKISVFHFQITEALTILESSMPSTELDTFCHYFKNQWIQKFKPEIWNHFESSDHRTNNRSEGFHSKLNKLVNKSHPSIFQLINILKQIDSAAMIQLIRVDNDESTISTTRRKKDVEKDLTIELIKQEYQRNEIGFENFFKKIRNQVSYFFVCFS